MSVPALVGVKNMITFSGTRTVLAGLGLALAGSVAFAPSASAVGQASAESAFRSAGITWTSSGGCTNPGNSTRSLTVSSSWQDGHYSLTDAKSTREYPTTGQ